MHNPLHRRRTALLGTALLIGINWANAQATQGIPRAKLSLETEISLQGDDYSTTILPLWETDLDNLDGYQNNNSMAVSGETVYVCVNHLDPIETGESASTIFIRRFNALNGEELQPWLIECPDEYKPLKKSTASGQTTYTPDNTNNFVIANDEFGNLLLVTFLAKDSSPHAPQLHLIPLSNDGELLTDNKVDITIQVGFDSFSTKADACLVTRVDRVEGDIASGNYKVNLLPGWTHMPYNNTYYYDYTEITVSTDENGETTVEKYLSRLNLEDNHPNDAWGKVLRPEIHFVAGQERYAVLTTTKAADLKGNGAPMLYRRNGIGNDIKFLNRDPLPGNPSEQKTCRGFHTLNHGTHTLAVYPKHFNETDGARFIIAEWPDASTFSNVNSTYATVPDDPFMYPKKVATSYYRQLITSRKVDNDNISGWNRPAGDDTPVSDIFICTPGSGIAAYRITPSDHTTALSDNMAIAPSRQPIWLEGNVLHIDDSLIQDNSRLTIANIDGRVLYSTVPNSAQLSLDRFPAGIYIATYGEAAIKVAIK